MGVSPCLRALLWTSCWYAQSFNAWQCILVLRSVQEFSHVRTPPEPLEGVCFSMLLPCRLQEVVAMETVCLADVCFVSTGSDTVELKTGSNITRYIGSDPFKNPRCWC